MKFWKRLLCRFTDHRMAAIVNWSPDATCLTFICCKCGKELGHLDLPAPPPPKKENLH